jgi:ribosome-interacting GTPase 1
MPANLTPQYHKAEAEYRRAATPDDELRCLQVMLRELPKHKGTDKLQADLKQKISRAKQAAEEHAKKGGGKGPTLKIPRQGAGRAIFLGGPNAGKSQLLRSLTRATPEVAPYPFTTHQPLPGMMPWEDVMVQLIDTPAITADLFDPTTQGLIRGSDLALLLVDLASDEGIEQVQALLEKLNSTKTRLAVGSYLDEDDIGLSFTQTILVPNKIDASGASERLQLLHEFCPLPFPEFVISAEHGTGLEELRNAIYVAMDVVRVYTKLPTKKEPDYERPFTIRRGGTLHEVAELVHRDFAQNLKSARVWGSHIHPGTTVKGDYVLHDKDVVELHV